METIRQKLRARLDAVDERIARACARSGRKRSDVTLVAVTKTISAELTALVAEMGILDLGENRPQGLWSKAEALGEPRGVSPRVRWHLIGHLQRNKIDRTLPLVNLIHAIDSVRLLQALEQEAARQRRTIPVFLEVNASGEASKQGFAPTDLPGLAPILSELKQVQVRGLMTMAALQVPEACRPAFMTLRTLRDHLRSKLPSIEQLSMGMSNDFEIAIEEGATFIRLGTVLFEGLESEPET